MSSYKLEKIKKSFIKNLFKDFIMFNKVLYFSSILFVMKINEDLRFYVDYRKFNVITKRNWYSLLLIKKIIEKIIKCKYFIKLNIIIIFKKFRMHINSENNIIFIIILNLYKYLVLLFNLMNDLSSFQQYINNTFEKFLNNFFQAYLDNILIYNYIKKKHICHVRLILNKL